MAMLRVGVAARLRCPLRRMVQQSAAENFGALNKSEFRFTTDHMWARFSPDGLITVGLSKSAVDSLGKISFVELPTDGCKVLAGDNIGAVESVKAATELYSPVSGTIFSTNKQLSLTPRLMDTDPYGAGWFCKVAFADEREFDRLLSWNDYESKCP